MTTIGVNILAPWVHDRARLYGWLAEAKPGLIVVCDEPDVAARCKMAVPGAAVAHRWVYDGDGDLNLTPAQWAARFLPTLPGGVVGYALNEPSGDWAAIAVWCAEVMSLAAAENKPLIVGNLAVGNPPPEYIEAGAFDPLLRAFNEFPIHWFGVHEYFRADPTNEPYLVGRYRALRDRARQIGARVRFAVTEAGRDYKGGALDGWQSVMDAPTYAAKLAQQASVYAPDGMDMAVFCYGTGGSGAWNTFDIQDAPVVLDAIRAYNAGKPEIPEVEDVVPWGLKKVQTIKPGANVNMRSEPKITAPVLRTVQTGDYLRPYGTPVRNGTYTWQKVNDEHCKTGWVALEVLELV